MSTQEEHLRLLSIFHYVVGGLAMLFGTCFTMHIVMGIAMLMGKFQGTHGQGPPAVFGLLFVAAGSAAVLGGWTVGLLAVFAGRSLGQRRRYTFCLVMAGVLCIFVPAGTILGVFTLIVLLKPEVKALFPPFAPAAVPISREGAGPV